jgi:hypothetical protein
MIQDGKPRGFAITTKNHQGRSRYSPPRSSRLAWRQRPLKVPSNISLLQLPPRAPELNGQENILAIHLAELAANRIFKSFDDIVDHCRYASNTLIDQPWKIMSIAPRLDSFPISQRFVEPAGSCQLHPAPSLSLTFGAIIYVNLHDRDQTSTSK